MWLSHPSFLDMVTNDWVTEVYGSPMYKLQSNLKHTKARLKIWNKEVFGNIHRRVFDAQDKLKQLEYALQANWDTSIDVQWKEAKLSLQQELNREECLYRQKARREWLQNGDKSTEFFQSIIKKKRNAQNNIRIKSVDGSFASDKDLIWTKQWPIIKMSSLLSLTKLTFLL